MRRPAMRGGMTSGLKKVDSARIACGGLRAPCAGARVSLIGALGCGLALIAAPAFAQKEGPKLMPDAQIEQVCNVRAMADVRRQRSDMRPEEVVAYAYGDTIISETAVRAPGGAVRSRGKWYRMSYKCETNEERTQVLQLEVEVGDEIPQAEWEEHNLSP